MYIYKYTPYIHEHTKEIVFYFKNSRHGRWPATSKRISRDERYGPLVTNESVLHLYAAEYE